MIKKRIAVCISGFGSNLQAIIDGCYDGLIDAEVVIVGSNKKNAYGLERAKDNDIKYTVQKDAVALFNEIEKENPDIIALAGYMKIVPEEVVNKFKGKIINIHPSLLPEFPGLHSIERALASGNPKTGVTVHYVDEGVDTGKIISQVEVPIEKGDTLEILEEKIHTVEHDLYTKVLVNLLK